MSSGKLNGDPSNYDTLPVRITTLSIVQYEGIGTTFFIISAGENFIVPGYIS